MTNFPAFDYSIFALDVYNRDYGVGALDPHTGAELSSIFSTPVGSATLLATSLSLGRDTNNTPIDQENDFAAAAYQVGDEIVVSFRGAGRAIHLVSSCEPSAMCRGSSLPAS